MFDFSSLLSLNMLIITPFVAALLVASPLFGTNAILIRRFSKTFCTIHFLYTMFFVALYNLGTDIYYDEITVFGSGWLSKLGINAAFGADGFTILLCAFTSLIFLLSFTISKTIIRTKHKMFYTLLFLLYGSSLGIFCAKDMFIFLLFWQSELIPLYFLTTQWGAENSKEHSRKYITFNFIGSIFIIIGMIALYYYGYHSNGTLSSSIDFLRIYQSDNIFPLLLQKIIFWCFFIGFVIKLAVFPFHKYFTNILSDVPLSVRVTMSSILTATASYGLIRFNLDLFPEIFYQSAPMIMGFSVISLIWSSLCAFKQKDIVKIVSYIGIAYLSIFLLGISSMSKTGFNGAFYIIFSNIILLASMTILVGYIQQAVKTKSLQEITGLGSQMPRLMYLSYIVIFSAINIPLTAPFIASLQIFTAVFLADFPNAGMLPKICTLIALMSIIFLCSSTLKLFNGIFCGTNTAEKKVYDITGHRLIAMLILVFSLLLFGLCPNILINFYDNITDMLIEILRV